MSALSGKPESERDRPRMQEETARQIAAMRALVETGSAWQAAADIVLVDEDEAVRAFAARCLERRARRA